MDRRQFLGWVGAGGLASSLPFVIAACSTTPSEQSQASPAQTVASPAQTAAPEITAASPVASRSDGFQVVGTVAELQQKGFILNEKVSGGPVLVIPNPNDPKAVLAVNLTCTHNGCLVKWQAADKAFSCPCHGARFAPTGQVLKPPAQTPLPTYGAKVEGKAILVRLA